MVCIWGPNRAYDMVCNLYCWHHSVWSFVDTYLMVSFNIALHIQSNTYPDMNITNFLCEIIVLAKRIQTWRNENERMLYIVMHVYKQCTQAYADNTNMDMTYIKKKYCKYLFSYLDYFVLTFLLPNIHKRNITIIIALNTR